MTADKISPSQQHYTLPKKSLFFPSSSLHSNDYNDQKTSICEWRPDSVAYGGVSKKHFRY